MKLPFVLQEEESVLLFCRRHWMHLYPRLIFIALAGLLPIAALFWLVAATTGLDGAAGLITGISSAVWGLFWLIRGYFTWYRYNNDVWAVTNQRIVDSLKRHWFHHRMASADLIDVEDIAVDREGVLQTAFDFGDVRCQTAGEVPNFVLAGIPEPAKVLAVVDSARDTARRELSRPYSQ
ncbi:MAG: hypothetical protein ACR2HN_03245 [Tepidiformaceae bacterium]